VPAASTPVQVAAAAERLASRMFAGWSKQVVDRGIQLPAPVRVRWQWADSQLAVPREELNASPPVATDPRPIPGTGVGEVLSSGLVTRLHDRLYARLRHGRLVLIGGPGAGKSAAMILLLLEALSHREQTPEADRATVPVPVWLTLGSWDPHTQGLREWVTTTMARDHPYLRAGEFGPDAIGALFDTRRVALFLDGLDEMPAARRVKAIERLQAEAVGLRMVLTSRPDEWQTTLATGAQLVEAAVVDLQPVGVQAAVDYLLADRAEPARQAWAQLTDRLQDELDGVLARTLNTPLTLSLARTAYPTDPAPLLDPALGTEPALRRHLLDQVLVTAYPNPRERDHATYWLGWIAHHMTTQPDGLTRDLPWWHIPSWVSRWHRRLMGGLVFGLVSGLVSGLGLGFGDAAVAEVFLAEVVLAAGGRRVRFMWLLQTASDRQVLRQAGAVYQFRHADLQDRLAERFARDHLRTGDRAEAPAEVPPAGAGRGSDVVDLSMPAAAAAEGAGSAAGE
jgi:hypothetical protein